MRLFIYIFIILFAEISLAQNDFQDTTWFDKDWKISNKSNANFYRVYKKTEKGYEVKDMYINGMPQMIAEVSDMNPELIHEGLTRYYSINNEIFSKGFFKNNKALGKWVEYTKDGKDSTVCIIHEDGHKEYLRLVQKLNNEVYSIAEVMPEYPGGISEMYLFFSKSTKYPKKAKKKGWEGKSYLNFIINENGEITFPKIVKSSGYDILDEEALRVIKSMPNWSPGSQNGKNVLVSINIPLNFTLKD